MIEIRDLDGTMVLEPINGNLEVKGVGNATAVSHLVFSIGNLHIKDPALINIILYIDDKEIDSLPLYVRKG